MSAEYQAKVVNLINIKIKYHIQIHVIPKHSWPRRVLVLIISEALILTSSPPSAESSMLSKSKKTLKYIVG